MTDGRDIRAGKEPTPELLPALEALEDAHETWHDAFDAYHEPKRFRRQVEALIQTLRNVTFRLQSAKRDVTFDFESFYAPWQEYMKDSPPMKWLNAARVDITKRHGLATESFAKVRIITSYLEPETTVLRLPADIETDEIVDRARDAVPEEHQQHVAIEVKRQWRAEGEKQPEVLFQLMWCFHILDALLVAACEAAGGETVSEAPSEFMRSVALWPCMMVPPNAVPALFEADTGLQLDRPLEPMPTAALGGDSEPGLEPRHVAAAKTLVGLANEPLERAGQFHNAARQLFKADGAYFPTVQLETSDGWRLVAYQPRDKRDKYLFWHEVGRLVWLHRATALISTAEAWTATASDVRTDYEDLSERSGRGEVLITHVLTSGGESRWIGSGIFRVLGKPMLRRAREMPLDTTLPGYWSPVKRAWDRQADYEAKGP